MKKSLYTTRQPTLFKTIFLSALFRWYHFSKFKHFFSVLKKGQWRSRITSLHPYVHLPLTQDTKVRINTNLMFLCPRGYFFIRDKFSKIWLYFLFKNTVTEGFEKINLLGKGYFTTILHSKIFVKFISCNQCLQSLEASTGAVL